MLPKRAALKPSPRGDCRAVRTPAPASMPGSLAEKPDGPGYAACNQELTPEQIVYLPGLVCGLNVVCY